MWDRRAAVGYRLSASERRGCLSQLLVRRRRVWVDAWLPERAAWSSGAYLEREEGAASPRHFRLTFARDDHACALCSHWDKVMEDCLIALKIDNELPKARAGTNIPPSKSLNTTRSAPVPCFTCGTDISIPFSAGTGALHARTGSNRIAQLHPGGQDAHQGVDSSTFSRPNQQNPTPSCFLAWHGWA